jgi:uncharacterized protein YjaG (DUF416 family)
MFTTSLPFNSLPAYHRICQNTSKKLKIHTSYYNNLIEKVKSTPFKFNVEFNFSKLTMEVSLSKRYDVFGSASVRRYLQI